jgi:hypothetical protein
MTYLPRKERHSRWSTTSVRLVYSTAISCQASAVGLLPSLVPRSQEGLATRKQVALRADSVPLRRFVKSSLPR